MARLWQRLYSPRACAVLPRLISQEMKPCQYSATLKRAALVSLLPSAVTQAVKSACPRSNDPPRFERLRARRAPNPGHLVLPDMQHHMLT